MTDNIIEIGKKPELLPAEEFTCDKCFHGVPQQGGIMCKRNPPQVLLVPMAPKIAGGDATLTFQSVRPMLPPNDTCGEWESKEEMEDGTPTP